MPCLLLQVLVALVPAAPATAALIHSWAAEGNAQDGAGDADGTLVGGTTFGDGMIGDGFVLDGVDDEVTFGTTAGNFGTGDFTVAFAVDVTGAPAKTALLSKRAACTATGSFWDIRMREDGTVGFELRQSNVNIGVNTGVSIADGELHTVVFTRTGTVMSAYVDGIRTASFDAAFAGNVSNAATLTVGDGPCVGVDGTVRFAGTIDEVRIADSVEPYLLLADFVCGDAALNGAISAVDALTTLRTAVGSAECPACVCDVNASMDITASDSLAILRAGVGQPVVLECMACEF